METCVFCKIISGEYSCYKLYEDESVISFLSIDPISYGHTLIIPKKHTLDFADIDLDTLNHINAVAKEIYFLILKNLKPDGVKFVQNNGSIQEVKHYHLHLIPVWDKEKEGKENLDEVLKEFLQ